jgi:putative protease
MDATPKELPDTLAKAKELLKLSFGRVPTKGFLASHHPTDIATPTLRGATGRFLGEVKGIKGDRISFESRDRLHLGDRIRIQPKSDMAGRAFTIKELFVDNRPVKAAAEKSRVVIPSPFAAAVGDAIFKVSSETAFTMSENACLKKLASVRPEKLPCRLHCSLAAGELTVRATVAGQEESVTFPLGELAPSHTSDMVTVLAAQFSRTGDTPFSMASLEAPLFPPLLIPPARLKEIRRDFYQQLAQRIMPALGREREERRRRAHADLAGRGEVRPTRRPEIIVRVEQLTDLHLLNRDGIDRISLPVSRANLHQLSQAGRRLRGREGRVSWRLPFYLPDGDIPWYREALQILRNAGFRQFEAANISHFPLLGEWATEKRSGDPPELITDYRLFSLNSQAIAAWQELGAVAVTLYIEDDAHNLGELLAAELPITRRVMVFGEVPAITSKIDIKEVKSDTPVLSDRGEGYRVTSRSGLTQITPTKRFSFSQFRDKLLAMGCSSFVLDLAHLNRDEQERVLAAFAAGREIPDTSPFNFLQGLL